MARVAANAILSDITLWWQRFNHGRNSFHYYQSSIMLSIYSSGRMKCEQQKIKRVDLLLRDSLSLCVCVLIVNTWTVRYVFGFFFLCFLENEFYSNMYPTEQGNVIWNVTKMSIIRSIMAKWYNSQCVCVYVIHTHTLTTFTVHFYLLDILKGDICLLSCVLKAIIISVIYVRQGKT